jgi:GAF domain-containing protein
MELADNKGVIGFVIQNRKPMVIQKTVQDTDLDPDSEVEKIHYQSILCVPIISKNIIRGVMGFVILSIGTKWAQKIFFL